MSPDLEKRVPREILEELIEEGTEAFRGILEKLFNVAMQLERSEFLGAEAYERTKSRRGYRNGFKGKRIRTRVGELRLEIPQVRGLRFYPKSLERGCRSEKAIAEIRMPAGFLVSEWVAGSAQIGPGSHSILKVRWDAAQTSEGWSGGVIRLRLAQPVDGQTELTIPILQRFP